jgi:RimJ/RimL family protein N-acetyltransferase
MFFIESERLRMIPLTHQLLQLSHTNRPAMEQSLGLNPSAMWVAPLYKNELEDAMINFWLPKSLENPDRYQWYTNWEIILKSINTSIGGMGFNGYPNEQGEAEIGYMIDGNHQNKGYATEALKLLADWTFTNDFVKAIIIHTYADNLPSRRLLDKCDFERTENVEGLLTYRLCRPTSAG